MEEEDEIQAQACKFPRFGNGGRNDHPINNKIVPRDHHNILHNEDVENIGGEVRTRRGVGGIGDGGTTTIPPTTANNNRLHNWHHSSRIIRVSRASGGKDRHSKVMTSKGLRDRRVRLSVTTAIQFYDLQDRLGYDQPSKAVEWLIKSAADAISELPSLNNTFPDTPKQLSDEKRGDLGLIEQGFADDSADAELDHGDEGNYNNNNQQQQNQSQNLSLSKSACSSTSETSKGSGLSLSRSDIRVKARERARERAAKEKKKDTNTNTNNESLHQINAHHQHHQNMNPVSQTASFTELLTGGINNAAVQTTNSPTGSVHQNHGSDEPNNLFNKAAARQQQQQQWGSAPMEMDYFSPLFLGASSSSRTQQHHHQSSSSGFSSAPQFQLGHSLAEAMSFNVVSGGDSQNQNHHHHSSADQMQLPFSFIHDHLMPAVVTSSHQHPGGNNTNSHNHNNNDYNLNFTMLSSSSSLGLAGYNNNNRGTLQSNSSHPSSNNNNNNNNNNLLPHHHHHLQRFSVPTIDGSTVPFFFGAAAAAAPVASAAAAAAMESHNHHQHQLFSPVFDGRLQLCYGGGDGSRHSDQKGKAKN